MNLVKTTISRNKFTLLNIVISEYYLFFFILVLVYKYRSAYYRLYTSDLFTYDTMLQETLKGFFGMEYTYGNLFGDHASLLLLLFLPVKWILGKQMIFFLLLLTPLMYLIGGLFLLYYLKKSGTNIYFYFLTGMLYAFQLFVFYANYEGHYGYHIDTASGYMIIILALTMILYFQYHIKNRFNIAAFIASYSVFVLMKEEMALLAFVFFIIVFLFKKNRKLLTMAGISLFIFLFEIGVVHFCKTSFNRGNELILSKFIGTLSEKGIVYYFISPDFKNFWLPFILLLFGYILFSVFNKFNSIAFALFLTGLIKIAFSFSIGDFDFTGWHAFPALTMLIGALIIQAAEKKKKPEFYLPEMLIVFLVVFFISRSYRYDMPYILSAEGCLNENTYYKNATINDLNEIKKRIPKDKVIALNGFLAFEFRDGYRYSFYPRGIEGSPCAIADYVLIDKEITGKLHISPLILEPGNCVRNEFNIVAENRSYVLYKRDFSKIMTFGQDRIGFIRSFGKESIGKR